MAQAPREIGRSQTRPTRYGTNVSDSRDLRQTGGFEGARNSWSPNHSTIFAGGETGARVRNRIGRLGQRSPLSNIHQLPLGHSPK